MAAGSIVVTIVRYVAVALLSLALLAPPVSADVASDDLPPGQLKARVYGGADGLENVVVIGIAQDHEGMLWLGTDDGAFRFDGEHFTHFTNDDGLGSSQVLVVGTAPDGAVCIGGERGLRCRRGTRFSLAGTEGLPLAPVRSLASFGGRLWVGTESNGLYVERAGGGFEPVPGWSHTGSVHAMWADGDGLVVGDGATLRLVGPDGVWRGIGEIGLAGDRIEGVLRDHEGALWIRTAAHLWCLPRGAPRATDLRDGLPPGYDAALTAQGMAVGARGELLVATDAGVARRERGRWRVLDHTRGMPAAGARALFVDRGGTLWISSVGLIQVRGRDVIESYPKVGGFPGGVAWSYRRDRDGVLWAGTSDCLARAIAGRWQCLPGTEGRVVRSFVFAPQGGVFVGGAPSDLLYIDPAGHPISLGDFHRPAGHNILALALGPEGDLWIGTGHGLFRLPGAVPGEPVRVDVPGVRGDDRFPSLLVVGDQLWTASETGVLVRDRGVWHRFDASAGFRGSSMRYVIARHDGRICVAYHEALGVTCFRYAAGEVSQIENLGTDNGLTTGLVYLLGEDRDGRLWVGTGNGLDVIAPHGVDHFDELDGVAGNDSAATAFLLDDDGSLWLGAVGGATHVLAQFYRGPPSPPRTAILDGQLGGASIHALAALGALDVPHDRGSLTAEFAADAVVDARRVQYQIRLSPIEAAWSQIHQRDARYAALAPGAYRFEVRARVGAGAWGPATTLDFVVEAAWWQSRWFIALAGFAALIAVVAAVTWRQRRILQRRVRQAHDQSDAGFRTVIDMMPDLIALQRRGQLIYINQACRRFLGVDTEPRWAERDLLQRVHPGDRAQLAELFQRVHDRHPQVMPESVELRICAAGGDWRTCDVSAVIVEIGGERTLVASGHDVTERKRLHARLMVADRMASLGTLAAGIAHEINNPLTFVTGNLEVAAEALHDAAAPSARARDELALVISDARDGAERVRRIVHGLRAFSRVDSEQRTPLALSDVLDAAIRLAGNQVRHRAQLVHEIGPTPPVLADEGRLTQVFINLLINAAHAIPEGHADANRITVRTRTDARGHAVAEVEDTGRGMSPDVQARVFDPFFTTKDVGEGTGLGLSICHGIVTGLGGQIAIDSAPGRGTVMRVVLPPNADPPALPPPVATAPQATSAPAQRQRVLLVDDEPQVAQTIGRLLSRDYDVTIAHCGQDALAHIAAGTRFDAIVSDVMMPNMSGIDLIDELARLAPDQAQRLIFLSGGVFTEQTRERLERLGQLGVPQLEKPVTAGELRGWITRVAALSITSRQCSRAAAARS